MQHFVTLILVGLLFSLGGCASIQKSGEQRVDLTKAKVIETLMVYKTAWEQAGSKCPSQESCVG